MEAKWNWRQLRLVSERLDLRASSPFQGILESNLKTVELACLAVIFYHAELMLLCEEEKKVLVLPLHKG